MTTAVADPLSTLEPRKQMLGSSSGFWTSAGAGLAFLGRVNVSAMLADDPHPQFVGLGGNQVETLGHGVGEGGASPIGHDGCADLPSGRAGEVGLSGPSAGPGSEETVAKNGCSMM